MEIKLKNKIFEVTLNLEKDFDITKSGSGGWEWTNTFGEYYEGSFQWEDGKVFDWDGIDELPFSVPLAFMYIGLSIDDLPDVAEKKTRYLGYLKRGSQGHAHILTSPYRGSTPAPWYSQQQPAQHSHQLIAMLYTLPELIYEFIMTTGHSVRFDKYGIVKIKELHGKLYASFRNHPDLVKRLMDETYLIKHYEMIEGEKVIKGGRMSSPYNDF